jgi:endonuclease YncB( thermonuclease family)
MNKLLFLIVLISTLTFAQKHWVTKIIDNNIFELDNGQFVQLAEVYVPSIKESNDSVIILANQINKWAYSLLINQYCKIDFITTDSLSKVRIYRSRLFGDEDIVQKYILNGYAIFIGDKNSPKYLEYMEDQNTARNNSNGIWSLSTELLSKLSKEEVSPKTLQLINELESKSNQLELITGSQIKTVRPYLPLLAISIASFALAWDYFSQASDIQKAIDVYKTILPKGDYSDLESSETRKTVVAITCLTAGIITTLFSLKEVQVRTDLRSLTLSYRF